MKRTYYILLIITLFAMFSCEKKNIQEHTPNIVDTIKINIRKNYTTLFPPSVFDVTSSQIVTQLYTGLVRYNPKNLKIEPSIAKSWDKKNDTTYIFHIRNDVYFGSYPSILGNSPKQLKMKDILFTFQILCTQVPENKNFYSSMWKILGAKQYYNSHKKISRDFNIPGIKALNDSTLQITIEDKDFPLLKILATPATYIFSKDAYKKLGNKTYIGAGPYILTNPQDLDFNAKYNDEPKPLFLKYNPYYFVFDTKDSVYLPYVSNVKISFMKSEKKEIDMLGNKQFDIVCNVQKNNLIRFLESHIKEVNSNPPEFIVTKISKNVDNYVNIYRYCIKNFYSNELFFVDLSQVEKIKCK